MKKIFLLLIAFVVTLNSGAQELGQGSVTVNAGPGNKTDGTALQHYIQQRYVYAKQGAEKTTAGGSRWYFYGDAIDTSEEYQNVVVSGNPYQPLFFGETTIWNDTNGTVLNTGAVYKHVTNVCEGSVLDPRAPLFNTDLDDAYAGQVYITNTDPFIWDSVAITGRYLYNSTKTSVVDTLRLVFVTGAGGPRSSDDIFRHDSMVMGHYNNDTCLALIWDSLTNTATTHTYAAIYKQDIYLTNGDWYDTTSAGYWDTTIAVNAAIGISVAAGAYCGMSITFISGDPATKGAGILASPTPGDTLVSTWRGSGNNRYNVWQPLVAYYQTTGGTPAWPPYILMVSADNNLGYWKTFPNIPGGAHDEFFSPTWAQSDHAGASELQYPNIGYHLVCPLCTHVVARHGLLDVKTPNTVNYVTAVPNPTSNELNISFDLSRAADIAISLTNMLGQEVATQKIANESSGKAIFNTSALPAGVYIYTLSSNGSITTGRIAIRH